MYDPVNLVTGGVSGVAIIMKELARVPLWVTNTVLNIPLFLAAWKIKGWGFIKRTAVATVALSVSLYVIPEAHILMDDISGGAIRRNHIGNRHRTGIYVFGNYWRN